MKLTCTRRRFLQSTLSTAAALPFVNRSFAATGPAKVAVVRCRNYGAEANEALNKCLDMLGGVGSLVKNKTVTVKLNLTGTNFSAFMNRPVGETFMTHYDTAAALTAALFKAG